MQRTLDHIWSAFQQVELVHIAPAFGMAVIVILISYLRRGKTKSYVWVPGPTGRQYDEAFAKLRNLGLGEEEARKRLSGGWQGVRSRRS